VNDGVNLLTSIHKFRTWEVANFKVLKLPYFYISSQKNLQLENIVHFKSSEVKKLRTY